jgi:hypothetical protein
MKTKDIVETIEEDIFVKEEVKMKIKIKILLLPKIHTTTEDIITTMTMITKTRKNTMAITETIIKKNKMERTLMLQ